MADTTKQPKPARVRPTLIGGQAVMEGVMMMGATSMALAVRDDKGEILLETSRTPTRTGVRKVPVLRGIVNFARTMVTGTKTLMRSADVAATSDEDEGTLSTGSMVLAMAFAVVLAVALFIGIPLAVREFILNRFIESIVWKGIIEGLVRLAIFVGYLGLTSLQKDIRRTFMYHGAEHKTINCYESGKDLTVGNVRDSTRIHSRCGTTFLFFVIFLSIIVFVLAGIVLRAIWGDAADEWYILLAVRLLLLPLVAGLSYELLRFLARLPDNWFTVALKSPGLALQHLTTREPDDGMIEVAVAAFNAVREMDGNPDKQTVSFDHPFRPVREALTAKMVKAGLEDAEADWIFCGILGRKRGELNIVEELTHSQWRRAQAMAEKRVSTGLPLAYVLQQTEFFGHKVILSTDVLIPRPETELLAEQAILAARALPLPEILDLGTGSGCIALALAKELEKARIDASDVSPGALAVALQNLTKIDNIRNVVLSDLFAEVKGKYDIIVSNPPYIRTDALDGLQPEVKKEPVRALNGGEDGLDFYRRIAAEAPAHLHPDGRLLLEVGAGQAQAVADLLADAFEDVTVKQDYAGIDRIVLAKRKAYELVATA